VNTLAQNAPALLVVLPLLAALLTALAGRGRRSWWIVAFTTWGIFGISLLIARQVLASETGYVSYSFGPWGTLIDMPGVGPVHPGIEYRIDGLNAIVLLVITTIAAVVSVFARLSVAKEIPADRHHFFYAVYLLCITGLLGITITGDAFNLYVLLEISSLTSYALVAMGKGRDKRALTASYHYLILGTVGASFILIAIGYLFMTTGTLNMAEMAAVLAKNPPNRTVNTAFALLVVGLGLKMALFPVHAWLPNAYTYAPSAVTSLLASTATKVGIYVTLRFFFTIFGKDFLIRSFANEAMLFMGCAAIIHGSLMAIQQDNLKRLLAWSSVAQIGYMVVGLCLASERGLTGTLLHIVNHALVKGALFIAVGALIYRTGSARIQDLQGLFKRMPLTAAAITVAGLGLIGMPLTGGFVSKWFLVGGAIERGLWPVAGVILIGSVLAVVYVMKLVEPMVFGKADEAQQVSEAPATLILPAWLLCAGSIYCGVYGAGLRELVEHAVAGML
jgi:multicomponent Na+:H+ antiporter subunit D